MGPSSKSHKSRDILAVEVVWVYHDEEAEDGYRKGAGIVSLDREGDERTQEDGAEGTEHHRHKTSSHWT